MTISLRRLALAAVLALTLLAGAAPAAAVAQDNSAVAINTKDDSSLFDLAFSIKEVGGEVVDQTNQAVAYSNCRECQTVAIAIQVLIVTTENPDVVMPTNLAVAVNENCDTCVTMALAYQFVVGGAGLELTKRGERQLREIRRELQRLGRQGLSAAEIRDRTAALVERLRHVLATELVPRREHGPGGSGDRSGDEDDEPPPDEGEPPPDEPTDTSPEPQATTPQATAPQGTTPQQTTTQPPPEQPQQQPEPQEQPPPDGTTTTP
jgi:putative peptide zinc metalloprotease protein